MKPDFASEDAAREEYRRDRAAFLERLRMLAQIITDDLQAQFPSGCVTINWNAVLTQPLDLRTYDDIQADS